MGATTTDRATSVEQSNEARVARLLERKPVPKTVRQLAVADSRRLLVLVWRSQAEALHRSRFGGRAGLKHPHHDRAIAALAQYGYLGSRAMDRECSPGLIAAVTGMTLFEAVDAIAALDAARAIGFTPTGKLALGIQFGAAWVKPAFKELKASQKIGIVRRHVDPNVLWPELSDLEKVYAALPASTAPQIARRTNVEVGSVRDCLQRLAASGYIVRSGRWWLPRALAMAPNGADVG